MQAPTPTEAQLAARLMVGYEGAWQTHPLLPSLVNAGLAGVILFRHNLQAYSDVSTARTDLQALLASLSSPAMPKPLLAIDQEGGAVERFPPPLLANGLSPLAMAALNDDKLVATYYASLAEQLHSFGMNLNFAPTLDVNLNPANRVIGPRSFGGHPETVQRLAQTVISGHLQAGVCPVLKHFPGHGNGEVDSHEALPTLTWSEAEQAGFQQAISNGAPAVLVAHGLYPNAPSMPEAEQHLPASLSKHWMQTVLRGQLDFQGVIFSDDMEMGALAQTGLSSLEQAVLALNSGCDVLVYRNAGAAFTELWQGLCLAWEQGKIDPEQHEQALQRLHLLQEKLGKAKPQANLVQQDAAFTRLSLKLHHKLFETFQKPEALKQAMKAEAPLYVLLPQRQGMGNYSLDADNTPDLFDLLQQRYAGTCKAFYYRDEASGQAALNALKIELDEKAGILLFVSWLPRLKGDWLQGLQELTASHTGVLAGVHLATGLAGSFTLGNKAVIQTWPLHSYRPQSIAAAVEHLLSK